MTEQNNPYGQGRPDGSTEPQGRPPYGQAPYGRGDAHAPQPYEQQPYGQQPYGQPYGQPYQPAPYGGQPSPYGPGAPQAYGPYGAPPGGRPARPGGVVTAAVFGFIYGALGAAATLLFVVAGAVAGGAVNNASSLPGLGSVAGAAAGIAIALGLLALVWTVLMIWGSAWALTGRSRVLLIVGGSIAIAATGFLFFGSLANTSQNGPGSIVLTLVFFVVSILIVVLVANRSAGQFFRTHRALRAR